MFNSVALLMCPIFLYFWVYKQIPLWKSILLSIIFNILISFFAQLLDLGILGIILLCLVLVLFHKALTQKDDALGELRAGGDIQIFKD